MKTLLRVLIVAAALFALDAQSEAAAMWCPNNHCMVGDCPATGYSDPYCFLFNPRNEQESDWCNSGWCEAWCGNCSLNNCDPNNSCMGYSITLCNCLV